MSTRPAVLTLAGVLLLAAAAAHLGIVHAFEVVLNAQGEYCDAYVVNGKPFPPRVAFIDPDPADPTSLTTPPRVGRHVNGKFCFFPRRVHRHGEFVLADDTYREACLDSHPPQARCSVTDPASPFFVGKDPDGWAIFERSGKRTGEHIHTPWDFSGPQPQGNKDPQGCVFDKKAENTAEPNADASFASTSAIPGLVFAGKDVGGAVRVYDAATGTLLTSVGVSFTLASAPAVVGGLVILGGGAGQRSGDPNDTANAVWKIPVKVTALCVTGTRGCDPRASDRCDAGGSAPQDARDLEAVRAEAEASCPCAAFDDGPGRTHTSYLGCVRGALGKAIAAGRLRARCRSRSLRDFAHATCGRGG